jgi:hypothetical protein
MSTRQPDPTFAAAMRNNFPILEFFSFEHLPPHLQAVSSRFAELAYWVADCSSTRPAEKATALRKLLEAKDAAVRCALVTTNEKAAKL